MHSFAVRRRVAFVVIVAPALSLLLALTATRAGAQSLPAGAEPGTRVRVTSAVLYPSRLAGTVLGHGAADTLAFRPDGGGDPVLLPMSAVTGLEVSTGRHTRILKGAGMGLLVGAVAGGVIGYAATSEDACPESSNDFSGFGCMALTDRSDGAIAGAVLGGVSGALVGGLLGRARKAEGWRRVPLTSAEARVRVRPLPGGLALAATFGLRPHVP